MKLLILLIRYFAENFQLSAVYLLYTTFRVYAAPPVFGRQVAIE